MAQTWDPKFFGRSPMFEPLRACGGAIATPDWPARAALQDAIERSEVTTGGGLPLRLVAAGGRSKPFEERYEARIHLKGEMAFRERNWHDLLNVLTWLVFPKSKAALNARHYRALEERRALAGGAGSPAGARGAPNRGPEQDALTLFDEGGVIVASCDDQLLELIRTFSWKELFWRSRDRIRSRMRFMLFGHALYEKALRPFIGVTGRGVLLGTEPGLLGEPLAAQLAALDERVAAHISDPGCFNATRDLAVVPVLGVPGWCPENEREAFYDDADYFRPGRRSEGGRRKAEG